MVRDTVEPGATSARRIPFEAAPGDLCMCCVQYVKMYMYNAIKMNAYNTLKKYDKGKC
jgi:hypothetical protein